MPRRALVEHRPWLLIAIAAAVAFYFLRDNPIGGIQLALLKGAGVMALAAYAFRRAPVADGRLFALVMFLSSLGDIGIEFSFQLGGAAFFLSHLAAMALYLRNLRQHTGSSQKALAVALLLSAPAVSWFLTQDWGVTLYGFALGGMASTAWMSRFTRYRVGIGAVLFVVSDWLIFSQQSLLAESTLPSLLIWPMYFLGQFLIATGVVQTLRGDLEEEDD